MSFARCVWLNAPEIWRLDDRRLHVTTDRETDFWRHTYYGFTHDTGHLFGCTVRGDFTAQLRVKARYDALYDQAGIMVRIDGATWIKAGIERSDGQCLLSSVLTLGESDWAAGLYGADPSDFWVRATLKDGALRVQVSADGTTWPLARLTHFPAANSYVVGPMCCTPKRAGLQVEFSNFHLGPPLDKDLHDLS